MVLSILTLLSSSGLALSQVTPERLASDPKIAMDVYRMYEYTPQDYTPAPKGYKAVYISHYGRHGERYINRPKYVLPGHAVLLREKLTPLGARALAIVQDMADRSDNHWGDLTELSGGRMSEITTRLYCRDKSIFRPGRIVRSASTTEPRCLLSMSQSLAKLAALEPGLRIEQTASQTGNVVLAGCLSMADTCAHIQDAKRDSIFAAHPDADTKLKTLFESPGNLTAKDISDVTGTIVFVWKDYPCLGLEPFNLNDFISSEKIYMWTVAQTARSYSIYCRSHWWNSCYSLLKPLLDDIVSKANDALFRGDIAADLRFGQDYVQMSLFSAFRLKGHETILDYPEIPLHWDIASWCPMAGSIQLIFYTKKGAPTLVKLLVNERETALPVLKSVSGPYYLWDDVVTLLRTP